MNDDLLKAGSSAMVMSWTPTLPDRIERLRSPNFTGRPKAFVASDSIFGRKLFTLIRNGRATNSTKKVTTTIPATRNQRFFVSDRTVSRKRCFWDVAAVSAGVVFL